MASMDAGERLSLIKENLQEVLNQDLIEGILAEGRNPRIYWGTFFSVPPANNWNFANGFLFVAQERVLRESLTADISV